MKQSKLVRLIACRVFERKNATIFLFIYIRRYVVRKLCAAEFKSVRQILECEIEDGRVCSVRGGYMRTCIIESGERIVSRHASDGIK